ncbi:signal transducer and activator of transcription 1-alpha/beta-like [Acanthopagrus latus]|uniref:signal transducer and activator of transcription 1-alpha/beta-like n=1 Tax=Acanthopagrus latus TaxID=8177 RepID=UPI00187CF08E|nr:signal transducer and activator of transcription 1-alpha/beta-like [Acanthopagrus latus]
MAQWQDLLRLDSALQDRVSQLYYGRLAREIRHYLCTVIESQDWDSAAVDENKANTCLCALLMFLDEQWNRSVQENNILQGPDFRGMKDYLLKHFQEQPLNLAIILSECLKEEKEILASVSDQGSNISAVEQKWRQLDNKVNELKRQTLEIKKKTKALEVLNEKLGFIQQTWQTQVEQHVGLAKSHTVVEEECLKQANVITQTKQMLLQQMVNILKEAKEIVVTLTNVELPEWKCRQQMFCIGSPVDTRLDYLEKWFTTVAEVLQEVREQLQKLQEQNQKYSSTDAANSPAPLAEIETLTLSLYTKLLSNALVVEKQPIMSSSPQRPLILKTGVRFTMTVRFLVNLPQFKYLLSVKPVFDKDVEETRTVKGFRRFDLNSGDSKVMDVDTPRGGLVAEFSHMSIKEAAKQEKGKSKVSSEILLHHNRLGVTEELHIIKFVTELQHAGLQCIIEASSLPLVLISSTIQASSAWATIMWCNMVSTSEPRNLSMFLDPPPLTWQQMSQAISWQFLTVGQRGLDEHQLSMIREKIVDDLDLVHWNKFSKNESAWAWIDGILDLIKKHLVDLWQDGSIMGFVSRESTKALLQEKPTGTFLLRFSESNKDGAITFSWVEHSNGEPHVHSVQPYTKVELVNMCVSDIIYHYSLRAQKNMTRNPLLYLYPDIPKDAAFGRYYKKSAISAPKKVVDGYVNRTQIPVSDCPTPPPSPPRDNPLMDMEIDGDWNSETCQVFQEIFSEFLNFPNCPMSPSQSFCVDTSSCY